MDCEVGEAGADIYNTHGEWVADIVDERLKWTELK